MQRIALSISLPFLTTCAQVDTLRCDNGIVSIDEPAARNQLG
jgi:hypothetical protein